MKISGIFLGIIFSIIFIIISSLPLLSQEIPVVTVKLSEPSKEVSFSITSGEGVIVDDRNRDVVYFISPKAEYKIKKLEGREWEIISGSTKEVIMADICSLSVLGPDDFVVFNNKRYRGKFIFFPDPYKKIILLNKLPLEEYLFGVVPRELYSKHIEAMKAQAIVARTYSISHLKRHDYFDFCPTWHCQVYGGVEAEEPLSNQAVNETRGLVIACDGKLATQTLYHSTCGGHTENNENVFLTSPIPYLRGVPCYIPFAGGRKKLFFCRISSYFQWEVSWTKDELHKKVKEFFLSYYSSNVGNIKDISIKERGISGRVVKLAVNTDKGEFIAEGDEIRSLLSYKNDNGTYVNLKSNLFTIVLEDGTYRAFGGGWGHGVGLCQTGAMGMAYWGADYSQIIHHYFKDVEIVPDYGKNLK